MPNSTGRMLLKRLGDMEVLTIHYVMDRVGDKALMTYP
jgi:hypothetical protein